MADYSCRRQGGLRVQATVDEKLVPRQPNAGAQRMDGQEGFEIGRKEAATDMLKGMGRKSTKKLANDGET